MSSHHVCCVPAIHHELPLGELRLSQHRGRLDLLQLRGEKQQRMVYERVGLPQMGEKRRYERVAVDRSM